MRSVKGHVFRAIRRKTRRAARCVAKKHFFARVAIRKKEIAAKTAKKPPRPHKRTQGKRNFYRLTPNCRPHKGERGDLCRGERRVRAGVRGEICAGAKGEICAGVKGEICAGVKGEIYARVKGEICAGAKGESAQGRKGRFAQGRKGRFVQGRKGRFAKGRKGRSPYKTTARGARARRGRIFAFYSVVRNSLRPVSSKP